MANEVSRPVGGLAGVSVIETPRLKLEAMNKDVLEAFAAVEHGRAASLMKMRLGQDGDLSAELARMRLSQLREDAALQQWLLRAIVRQTDSTMIGHIGFHTAPNPAYLRDLAPDAVEIGYTIYAPYRRNGYATEAVKGMLQWATNAHGVRQFVASVSPHNVASLDLLRKLEGPYRMSKIGDYEDPDDGLEEIYLLRRSSTR